MMKLLSMNSVWVKYRFGNLKFTVEAKLPDGAHSGYRTQFIVDVRQVIDDRENYIFDRSDLGFSHYKEIVNFVAASLFEKNYHVLTVTIYDTANEFGSSVYFLEDKKDGTI